MIRVDEGLTSGQKMNYYLKLCTSTVVLTIWEKTLLAGEWVESEICKGLFCGQKRERMSLNCLEIKLWKVVLHLVLSNNNYGKFSVRCQNPVYLSGK